MDNNVLIALVTSVVALLVACISGLFSYFSTKRTTKVEKLKAYLQFLEHKMNKLEEAQIQFHNITDTYSDSEDKITSLALYLRDRYKKTSDYLETYSYLFTNSESQYKKLCEKNERISLSYATYMVRSQLHGELKDEYKDRLLPMEDLPSAISNLGNGIQELIQRELSATFKKFEDLSTK